ncbi:hypothetical protein EC501_12545 [Lysinibacillus halotolerans]|uniref:Uncharacterized protein n=1 Tax=Lysinibacillus halotolerans TaxID=1368476 RepID=A0A3M8H6L2_9BACI|nr:hypothetical protein EC501_12545 [Lysinibacillus halotolerans]
MIALILSSVVLIKKRKKGRITGVKSTLPSICFILIAILNIVAIWFDWLGLISWMITVILLIVGAYFTKYLTINKKFI